MSFEIGLTGLNAASSDLEIIADNIANSSTTGYKRSRVEFADVFAAGSKGVQVAAISQQFSSGGITFTDKNLDLAITGQGFFRVRDDGGIAYSRSGAFGVDNDGYIVNSANQHLTGELADQRGDLTGVMGDLQIDTSNLNPLQTTSVVASLNVDATAEIKPPFNVAATGPDPATYNDSTSLTTYDSLGTAHPTTLYFRKSAPNEWESYVFVDGNQVSQTPDIIQFNGDGSLNNINGGPPGSILTTPQFDPGGGANSMTLSLDYSQLTQYGSSFGVNALSQDGFTTGRLSSVSVDESGIIFARYSNGRSQTLGQVALTNFPNPQGLRRLGNTSWAESFGSGAALTGVPGSSGLGMIQSGALEDANVDLTGELVDMISAQRNYQANAQVISTADTIAQTIINLR